MKLSKDKICITVVSLEVGRNFIMGMNGFAGKEGVERAVTSLKTMLPLGGYQELERVSEPTALPSPESQTRRAFHFL